MTVQHLDLVRVLRTLGFRVAEAPDPDCIVVNKEDFVLLTSELGVGVASSTVAAALGWSVSQVAKRAKEGVLRRRTDGRIDARSAVNCAVAEADSEAPGISKAEAARRLGVSRQRVQQLAASGTLPTLPDGTLDPEPVARRRGDDLDPRYLSALGEMMDKGWAIEAWEMQRALARDDIETVNRLVAGFLR